MTGNSVSDPLNEIGVEGTIEPRELIERLATALGVQKPAAGIAAPVMIQLSQALSHRFEREDDDFDAAIQRAPWLTAGVLQLKGQHGEMLKIVDELQLRMQDRGDSADWPSELNEQLEHLVELFHVHANAECSLLQDSCEGPGWT